MFVLANVMLQNFLKINKMSYPFMESAEPYEVKIIPRSLMFISSWPFFLTGKLASHSSVTSRQFKSHSIQLCKWCLSMLCLHRSVLYRVCYKELSLMIIFAPLEMSTRPIALVLEPQIESNFLSLWRTFLWKRVSRFFGCIMWNSKKWASSLRRHCETSC